ncbi:MAG: nitrite/sulfite reductase [Candidatus Omnitrophota bacterium]
MALIKEEQIKADQHPFDVWEDLVRASREGFATIRPENFLRFRWFGIYQQRPKTEPYFMLRLKLPGGRLNATQLRVVAEVARDYGRGIADITIRQNFQFHWLTIEKVPEVLGKFEAVRITTRGACGDVTRNITGSPLAGLEPDEADDLQDIIETLHQKLIWDKNLANLPRKFKISITGSLKNAAQPEINDVGVYGFWKDEAKKTPAFAIRVGGGLSTHPLFSRSLPVALKREDIIPAVLAALGIFHDLGNRENRREARMKFLVESWSASRFLSELEKRTGRTFERYKKIPVPQEEREHFWGVIPQKQKGLYAVGLAVLAGRLQAGQLLALADLSEKYGNGELRATNRQNILLINIPEKNLEPLKKELTAQGFDLGANGIYRSLVVCTGREFCNLALVEVKVFSKQLIEYLTNVFKDFRETLTIHVTGCPNSCGQYQLADIGLMGVAKVVDGIRRDAFHIAVGGRSDAWGRKVFQAVLSEEVPALLENMIRIFLKKRNGKETFSDFCHRFTPEELMELFESHAKA